MPGLVSARSGCCSSHRGVCGCGCCDGSPLSATCAPYYPECNSRQNSINIPQNNLKYINSNKNAVSNQADTKNNGDSTTLGIIAASATGLIGYAIGKRKK